VITAMSSKLGTLFGGSTTAVAGTAGVAAVAVAAAVGFSVLRDSGAPTTDPVASTTVTQQAPVIETPADPPQPQAAAPDPQAEADPPVAPPAPMPPRFDVVRVDAQGSAVIAGQAVALSQVTLRLDGDPVEVTRADGGGNFVALLALAPSDMPRMLSLEAALDGGDVIAGEETVIIAPFAGPDPVADPVPDAVLAEAPPVTAPVEAGPDPASVAAAPPVEGPIAPAQDEAVAAVTPPDPPPGTEVDTPGIATLAEPPRVAPDTDAEPVVETAMALQAPAPGAVPGVDATLPAPPPATDPAAAPEAVAPETGVLPPVDPASPAAPVPAPQAEAVAVTAPAPAPSPAPQPEPQAPAVLIAGADGVRVLQSPGGAPLAQTDIRLDAISYDTSGEVILTGRGTADAGLRVLLNNQPIQMGEIGPGGDWRLDLPDVDPGTYTLSVEQVGGDGSVTARVDTPFLREDPERLAQAPMLVDAGVSVITVQPGFTLWGIAQANFGDGVLYVSIFEENRDQIRDPDLIFPGQIFALPDLPRNAPPVQ
jgi:nucleoid-associated protein YgaU